MDGTIISCAGAENNYVSTVFHKQVSFCSPRTYVELWYKIHVGSRHEKMGAPDFFDPSTMKFCRQPHISAALWHHQK